MRNNIRCSSVLWANLPGLILRDYCHHSSFLLQNSDLKFSSGIERLSFPSSSSSFPPPLLLLLLALSHSSLSFSFRSIIQFYISFALNQWTIHKLLLFLRSEAVTGYRHFPLLVHMTILSHSVPQQGSSGSLLSRHFKMRVLAEIYMNDSLKIILLPG